MKTRRILSLLLSFLFIFALMPAVSVQALTDTQINDLKANITLKNGENESPYVSDPNVVFELYKIINITKTDDGYQYEWNKGFFGEDETKFPYTLSLEEDKGGFADFADDSGDLKRNLGEIQRKLKDLDATRKIGGGNATFSGLGMGGYLIIPTGTARIYNPIFVPLEVEAGENGNPTLNSKTVDIANKSKEPNIVKVSDKAQGYALAKEYIHYTIEADIPDYGNIFIPGATVGSENEPNQGIRILDTLPAGMGFKPGGIVKITAIDAFDNEEEIGEAQVGVGDNDAGVDINEQNAVGISTREQTLYILINNYQGFWYENSYKKIKIEYDAYVDLSNELVSKDDLINPNGLINTARYEYPQYPYASDLGTTYKTDTETIYTMGFRVKKVDSKNGNTHLEGAKFRLYRKLTQAEIESGKYDHYKVTGNFPTLDGVEGNVIDLGETRESEVGTGIAKLNATIGKGTYYLVETKAPEGYYKLDSPIELEIQGPNEVVGGNANYYTAIVENSDDGPILPATGAKGAIILTICGILLMGTASVMFIIHRNKKKSDI